MSSLSEVASLGIPSFAKEKSFLFIIDLLSLRDEVIEKKSVKMFYMMQFHIQMLKYQLENKNIVYQCHLKDKNYQQSHVDTWNYIENCLKNIEEKYKPQILKFCNGFLKLEINHENDLFITAFQFTNENDDKDYIFLRWIVSLFTNMFLNTNTINSLLSNIFLNVDTVDSLCLEKNDVEKICVIGDKSFYVKRKLELLKKFKFIHEVAIDIDNFSQIL